MVENITIGDKWCPSPKVFFSFGEPIFEIEKFAKGDCFDVVVIERNC